MFAIHPLLCILSFWYPLLLSAKAIQRPNKNIQFLLLYWISYITISNLQFYLLELNVFPFKTPVLVLGDLIELWLFYSHGCLVITYYYLPKLFGQQNGKHVIENVDHNCIDPFVSTFVVRNGILQNLLRLINVRILPIDDLIQFNRALCKHYSSKQRRLSFLAFSLEYFCYMDLPTELHSRYLKSEKLIRDLSSSVLRATTASSTKSGGFFETPAAFESNDNSIVLDSFDDVIFTPRTQVSQAPSDANAPLEHPVFTSSSYPSQRFNQKHDLLEPGFPQALPKVRSLGHMDSGRKKALPRHPSNGLEPPYPLRSGSG